MKVLDLLFMYACFGMVLVPIMGLDVWFFSLFLPVNHWGLEEHFRSRRIMKDKEGGV